MKKPYFFLLLLFLADISAAAQKVTTAAAVDKGAILIGQPIRLTLQATFSNTHVPSFFTTDSLPHFEILNRSKIDTQATAGQTILKQTITLTSWDSGAWAIPAFSLAAINGAATKPIPVTVSYTPMPATQDYHDIKDIIEVEKPPRQTWYWYLIGAALILLFAILLFPPRKKGAVTETTLPKEGAYKYALKELDALKGKTALDDNSYFTELILIFRTYLQQGKGIHSFQQTSDDLGRQLQGLQLPHGDLKKLIATLQRSDFVKFARFTVTETERIDAWDEIKRSIVAIEQVKT